MESYIYRPNGACQRTEKYYQGCRINYTWPSSVIQAWIPLHLGFSPPKSYGRHIITVLALRLCRQEDWPFYANEETISLTNNEKQISRGLDTPSGFTKLSWEGQTRAELIIHRRTGPLSLVSANRTFGRENNHVTALVSRTPLFPLESFRFCP